MEEVNNSNLEIIDPFVFGIPQPLEENPNELCDEPIFENNRNDLSSNQMSIKDLLSKKFPDPNWLVPNMISAGIVNLSGRPKVGKSFLALQLAGAKATGGIFLGKELKKGKVLYIDLENSPARMQRRAKKMGISEDANLIFSFEKIILDNNGLKKLKLDIEKNKWDCVIIDTFPRALSIAFDQMKPEQMSSLIGELQDIALNNNMTIILIDHHRKSSREKGETFEFPIDDILGTTGKSAPLDTVIGLYRNGKNPKLIIIGRDIDDLELPLMWDKDSTT